jgi:hypothetical protein
MVTYKEHIYKTQKNWKEKLNTTSVRIQWGPEKKLKLGNLNYKSIQIGVKGDALKKYIKDWIVQIDNITNLSKEIYNSISNTDIEKAKDKLPFKKVYPSPDTIKSIINADQNF